MKAKQTNYPQITQETVLSNAWDSPVVSAVGWEMWVKGTEKSSNGRVRCAQRIPAEQIQGGQTLLISMLISSRHS